MLNCAQAVVVVINSMAVSRICFSYFFVVRNYCFEDVSCVLSSQIYAEFVFPE